MQKEYYVGKVGIWLVNLRKRVKKHFSNIVLEKCRPSIYSVATLSSKNLFSRAENDSRICKYMVIQHSDIK